MRPNNSGGSGESGAVTPNLDSTAPTTTAGRLRGSLKHRVAAVPLAVWMITGLWCSLLGGASLIWPQSYGLDEPAHIDMAYDYSAHPFHFFAPGQLMYTRASIAMQESLPGYPPKTRLADAMILPRSARPSFAQLGGHTFITGGQPNQMVEHPPLYYWLEAVVLRLPGVSGLAWDLNVWFMRLLSVVIMSPVPLLCWAGARRLLTAPFGWLTAVDASKLALLAAAMPLTIPNLVRDGASVDNDTLLVLATSVVVWLLCRVVTGDLTVRTAGALSVTLAADLWTKGFALALPPLILIGYLLGTGWREPRKRSLAAALKPLAVVALGGIVGGAWWLRNVIDYHVVEPNGFSHAYQVKVLYGPPDNKGNLSHFVAPFMSGFLARIWGEIGIPDLPSPGGVIIYGWLSVVAIGVVAALTTRFGHGTRRRLLVLAAVPFAYFAITFEGSYASFRQWSRIGPQAVQGRYIYGGVAALAILFALGWFKLARPIYHARLAVLVVIGAIATNATCWILLLRSWYAPKGQSGYLSGTKIAFHALLRWSPVPSWVTILMVVVLPVVMSVSCTAVIIRDSRTWDPRRPQPAE